jgi:hypothetical protein
MKTCDLKEVIYLPAGTFTHTSIKTCVFYFIKKCNGNNVLTTHIKISKATKKEMSREYELTKTHQTNKVSFYDYNLETDMKHLLLEVPIEELSQNNYSLNYAEYLKDDDEDKKYNNDFILKKIGDVCCIIKGDKKRSKEGKNEGLYPLYYCSILGNLYLDTYDYIGEGIIINKTNGSGKAMVYYGNNKYNVGETTLHFKSNNNEVQTKYIYYYLLHNIELIEAYFKGANQKSIVEDDLFKIKIPIPSLEKQEEIVKYLDHNDNLIKHLEKDIEMNKNLAKQFITNIIKSNNTDDKYESDSEDEDSDEEYNIIKYKDVDYIVENEQLYKINDDNTKGELFGTYKNNKVKKTK